MLLYELRLSQLKKKTKQKNILPGYGLPICLICYMHETITNVTQSRSIAMKSSSEYEK